MRTPWKGDSVAAKKLVVVLALTCAFTMMFAGVALAAAGSGSSGGSDPYSGTPTSTPHTGYTTTTIKCAVCHAVHRAPEEGQVLLRSSVANACTYCHITVNVSTVQVYGQSEANYTGDLDTNHQSTGSVAAGNSSCVSCHSVHGVGTISTTAAGDINEKILKATIGIQTSLNTSITAGLPWAFTDGTVRDGVVTAFCSQCHPYWTDQYDQATSGDTGMHIMTAATDDYSAHNTSATISSSLSVAWTGSNYCRSCHDAGGTDQTDDGTNNDSNFPHFTTGASRFLLSAASVASSATAIGAADPSQDGACLKCHRENDATTGVGLTY